MLNHDNKEVGWEAIKYIIESRRSVFPPAFSDKPVSRNTISLLLEAANWAPNHKLTQPWRFVVMAGNMRKKLGEFMLEDYDSNTHPEQRLEKKRNKLLENPTRSAAIIAICMKPDTSGKVPEWEELAATACAVQNLWLSATALGLGGYWSTPRNLEGIAAFLKLEKGTKCLGLFYLGYFDQQPQTPRRSPWNEKVIWMEE